MGSISEITSQSSRINTTLDKNNPSSAYTSAFFEHELRGEEKASGEKFSIDKGELTFEGKKVVYDRVMAEGSTKGQFLITNDDTREITKVEEEVIFKTLDRIPPHLVDTIANMGIRIHFFDMTPKELGQAAGWKFEVGGLFAIDKNLILVPKNEGSSEDVRSDFSHNLPHEIGHLIDKEFGQLSSTAEWREAFEKDMGSYSFNAEYSRFSPPERFADVFSYMMIGTKGAIERDCPNMSDYMNKMFECSERYVSNESGYDFMDFFQELNPNTDISQHDFNESVNPYENEQKERYGRFD